MQPPPQHIHTSVFSYSDPEYRYYVHHVPYSEYSSKQVDPLMEREEVLSDVGVHQAQWRLLRKRYSIRIEFEQAGSLGMYMQSRGSSHSQTNNYV